MAFVYQDLVEAKELINFPPSELKGMGQEQWKKFRMDMGETEQLPNYDFEDGIFIWKDEINNNTYLYVDGKPVSTTSQQPGVNKIHMNGKSAQITPTGTAILSVTGQDGIDVEVDNNGLLTLKNKANKNTKIDSNGISAIDTTYVAGDGVTITPVSTEELNPSYKISIENAYGLKAGTNITLSTVDTETTISTLGDASKLAKGFVRVGDNINVTDGIISVTEGKLTLVDEKTITKDSTSYILSVIYDDDTIKLGSDGLYVKTSVPDAYVSGVQTQDGELGVVYADGKTLNSYKGKMFINNMTTFNSSTRDFQYSDNDHIPTAAAVKAYHDAINAFRVEISAAAENTPEGYMLYIHDTTGIHPVLGTLKASATTLGGIYLVRTADTYNVVYGQYVTIKLSSTSGDTYEWFFIGNTSVDLSDYVKKTQKVAGIELTGDITKYQLEQNLFVDGEGIKKVDNGVDVEFDVQYDDDTIKLNTDNKLYVNESKMATKQYVDDNITTVTTRIANLETKEQNDVDTLTTNLTTTNTNLTNLSTKEQTDVDTINTTITTIQGDITNLTTYVDTQDQAVKDYAVAQDNDVKAYAVDQDNTLKTYVDTQDTDLKTYVDTQDTDLKTYVDDNFVKEVDLSSSNNNLKIDGTTFTASQYKAGTNDTTLGTDYIKVTQPTSAGGDATIQYSGPVFYVGTTDPVSTTGKDGDIYIQYTA